MEDILKQKLYDDFSTMNALLQKLNDILGPDETQLDKDPRLKIRIPTVYIRSVDDFCSRLSCVKDGILRRNLAYQLQLSDFFSWVLTRTDVG